MPPYSSITSAIWVRVACIRTSRSIAGMDGGTNSTGRRIRAAASETDRSTSPRFGRRHGACGGKSGFGARRDVVEKVADVNHAFRIVEGLAVDRQARMACGAEQAEQVAERRLERNRDDIGARDHHVVDPQAVEPEDVLEHRPLVRRERRVRAGFRQGVFQIVPDRVAGLHMEQMEQAFVPGFARAFSAGRERARGGRDFDRRS